MNRYLPLMMVLLLGASAPGQDQSKRIGEIEFFGSAGIDVNKIRAVLPLREGDDFDIETAGEKITRALEAVRQMTGHPPTDIAPTCCDDQKNWIIYIGLAGKATKYNPHPKGTSRLPVSVIRLYQRFMSALGVAVQKGAAGEDRSKGYALSEDPALRATQLEMRGFAIPNEALVRKVLATSASDEQRIAASEVLGFARQSGAQLMALAHASRDSNSTVRNNATRALLVLAASNPKPAATQIPPGTFVELLLSGTWTDVNKSSSLLSFVTQNIKPKVLAQLRTREVQERLIEIARWRTGHAQAARLILGRLAGIDEERLQQLVSAGQVETIIHQLQGR